MVFVKSLVLFLLLGFLSPSILLAGAPAPPTSSDSPRSAVNETAPDFELAGLDGKALGLSGLRGKVVLLTFWASWCPPCRQEMPSQNQLHSTLGGEDFQVVGVNIDKNSSAARRFAEDFDLVFPILLDPDQKVQKRYGVYNIPVSFLIDRNGIIVNRRLGVHDWTSDKMLQDFKTLIGSP